MTHKDVSLEVTYWNRFVAGDDDAFRLLYDIHVADLFAMGCRYCKDENTVKDGIQDLFVDLFTYRDKLSTSVNVRAYLFRSLRRKLFQSALHERKKNEAATFEPDFNVEWDIERITIEKDTESALLLRLAHEIDCLPDRQREALYLRFSLEMDYNELAKVMDVSVATCRTLVYRAIKDLRSKMGHTSPYSLLLPILFFKK